MITLKVEDKDYQLPTSWKEVNIKQYIEIQKILKEDLTDLQQTVNIISILSGCPLELLYQVNLSDLAKINLNWLNEENVDIELKIEIDGKKYGVVKDMKNLSLGEYVDLDYYSKNYSENLHRIVAILMRPIIKEDGDFYDIEKYDSKTVEDRAKIFYEKMNVSQLVNLSNFFFNSVDGYIKNLTHYS